MAGERIAVVAKIISQREARRLRKDVVALQSVLNTQRRTWAQEYIGGVEIARIHWDDALDSRLVAVRTARKLNHAVVVVGDDGGTLRLVALPHPK